MHNSNGILFSNTEMLIYAMTWMDSVNTLYVKEARFKRYHYISMKCPEKKNLTETSYWLPGNGEDQGEVGTRFNCNQA